MAYLDTRIIRNEEDDNIIMGADEDGDEEDLEDLDDDESDLEESEEEM